VSVSTLNDNTCSRHNVAANLLTWR